MDSQDSPPGGLERAETALQVLHGAGLGKLRPRGLKWRTTINGLLAGKSQVQIAREVGITPQAVNAWVKNPNFNRLLEAYTTRINAEVVKRGIANKDIRLQALNEQAQKLRALQEARANEYAGQHPGAETGQLVRDLKSIGSGPNAQVIEEWTFDAAAHKALTGTLEQAAKEMGGAYSPQAPIINVQSSVIVTSDTPSAMAILKRNDDVVDV